SLFFSFFQALARIRDSEIIELGDFEEAVRLCDESKRSVLEHGKSSKRKAVSPTTQIIELIKRMKQRLSARSKWNGWIPLMDIERQVLAMGMKKRDIEETITIYVGLAALILNEGETAIGFPEDITEEDEETLF
ncbi:hypothetical protein IE077_000159, partial [Cardiosporidium cionae]